MDNASFAHFSCKNFHLQLIHNVQQCDDFLDVALWVEGKTIYAHRVILAAGSPVFHQMFKHHETTEKIPISKKKFTSIFHKFTKQTAVQFNQHCFPS